MIPCFRIIYVIQLALGFHLGHFTVEFAEIALLAAADKAFSGAFQGFPGVPDFLGFLPGDTVVARGMGDNTQ